MVTNLIDVLSRISRQQNLLEGCRLLLNHLNIKIEIIEPQILPINAFFESQFIQRNKDLFDKIKELGVVGIASDETFTNGATESVTFDDMNQPTVDNHYKEMALFSIDIT